MSFFRAFHQLDPSAELKPDLVRQSSSNAADFIGLLSVCIIVLGERKESSAKKEKEISSVKRF